MATVTVEVPEEVFELAGLPEGSSSSRTTKLLALELFREQKVSLSRAAELCHTALAAFMEFVSAHDVSPLRYGIAELEEDRRTLAELGL